MGNKTDSIFDYSSEKSFPERLKNLVFGTEDPDNYTRVTFFLNLFFWVCNFIWSIASYLTISFRGLILEKKNINVEEIIENRGRILGFLLHELMPLLLTVHSIGIICWTVVFMGLVLLWRKNTKFIYFILGGLLFYVGMLIFYLDYAYFVEDTTLFDKISWLMIFLSSIMYFFLLRKERAGKSIDFFEVD